jgi:hypothetical protein
VALNGEPAHNGVVPYLIAPIRDISLKVCIEQLTEAHDCLVRAATEMLAAATAFEPRYWGSDFKRSRVTLPTARLAILQHKRRTT